MPGVSGPQRRSVLLLSTALAHAVTTCRTAERPQAAVSLATALRPAAEPVVRYVANAGVAVDVEGRRFLIDAVFRDGIAPYAVSTPVERARIE